MNNYELELLGTLFNINKDDIFHDLASGFNIEMIIKTSGEKGATLYSRGQLFSSQGIKTRVRNTVGSGDAFLAAFMLNYLRGETPESALARANILGAFVAGTEGAIPDYSINDDWQPKLKDRIE